MIEDRLPEALARIAESTPVRVPSRFDLGSTTSRWRSRPNPSGRVLVVAAVLVAALAGLIVMVVTRPAATAPASPPSPPVEPLGPSGAMALPSETGMHVQYAEGGALAGDTHIRWYASSEAHPESASYVRLLSYWNGAGGPGSLGCVLADPATTDTVLTDGTAACLAVRSSRAGDGRIAIVRFPYSVVIEGDVTDEELRTAAEHVVATGADGGFEISAGGLPDGVALTGVGTSVSDFAFTSAEAASQPMASAIWEDGGGRSIFYVATRDPEAFLPNLRLGFGSITDVTVRGVPGFLRTIADQPDYRGLVWFEDGMTFQVGSQNLTDDELLAMVEQLRPATQAEWQAALDAAPSLPTTATSTTVTTTG